MEFDVVMPQVVESWQAGWNTRDGERFAALFTEDCTFEDIPFGLKVRGRDHIKQVVRGWTQVCPDYVIVEADGFASGSHVAVRWRMTAGTDDATRDPELTSWELQGISVLVVDEAGLICREVDVYDGRVLVRRLGLPLE